MLYYPLQVYHLACLNFRIYAKFLFILSYAASHDGMTFIEELRLEDAVQHPIQCQSHPGRIPERQRPGDPVRH